MKKIILIMAVVVMAMVSSPVFGDDFEDWYSGRTKWDGTPRYIIAITVTVAMVIVVVATVA